MTSRTTWRALPCALACVSTIACGNVAEGPSARADGGPDTAIAIDSGTQVDSGLDDSSLAHDEPCVLPAAADGITLDCPMGTSEGTPFGGVYPFGDYVLDEYVEWTSTCGGKTVARGVAVASATEMTFSLSLPPVGEAKGTCATARFRVEEGQLVPVGGGASFSFLADYTGITLYDTSTGSVRRVSHWKPR